MGDKSRIELFARIKTNGWISVGEEVDGKDIRDVLEELKNVS
jgi:N6-adenosine-specific RNA methylase IME4